MKRKRGLEKNAFIFTTDAFLALPLVVLAISTFIVFSINLKDNITIQGYAYLIAKDAMNVLLDASPKNIGQSGEDSFAFIIAQQIANENMQAANSTAVILDSIVPSNAAFILEYKSALSNDWKTIRVVDRENKISQNKYIVQVSNTRLIVDTSTARLVPSSNCPAEIVCVATPIRQYTPATLIGPILLRIRIFI